MNRIRSISRIVAAIATSAALLAAPTCLAEVLVVVSAKNTTRELAPTEVADIFLGRLTRFPDGQKASPVDQTEGSAARIEFYARVAGKSPAQLKAYWSKIIFTGRGQPPPSVANGAEVLKRVRSDASAIGYLDSSLIDGTVRVLR